jgi:hypothetical protein
MKSVRQFTVALGLVASANATTPKQAAARWAAFAPGMNGKIAYGDVTPHGRICVLDLVAGETKEIAKFDVEADRTVFGSACFRWSPSGKRLMVQNYDSVSVLNEDGTNFKRIAKANACCDMIWGDWVDDSAIVYSTGKTVVRTAVHADNTPGATETLVSNPPSGDGYTCVGINGDYLTYLDYLANQKCCGGGHRTLVKNLKTGAVTKLIADKDDMCQLTNIPDTRFRAVGEMWTHLVPGTICDSSGNHVEELPRIGTYPQREFSWSNQLEYFMSQGENSSNQWAWIRSWSKRGASANIVVSDTGSMVMYFPDLWVEKAGSTRLGRAGSGDAWLPAKKTRIPSLSGIAAEPGTLLFDAKGAATAPRADGSLSAGIYIIETPGAAPERLLPEGK